MQWCYYSPSIFLASSQTTPRPLSSFDAHARWQQVTQSAQYRQSYRKIEDREQSILFFKDDISHSTCCLFESLHHVFKTNWCMNSLLSHHISNQGNEPQSVDKSCQNEPMKGHTRIWYTGAKSGYMPSSWEGSQENQMPSSWKFGEFLWNSFPKPLESITGISLVGITKQSRKHKWLCSLAIEVSWDWSEVDAVSTLRTICVWL